MCTKLLLNRFHIVLSNQLYSKKKFRPDSLFSVRLLLVKAVLRYTKSKLPTQLSWIKIECVYILKNISGVLGPLKGNQELINMQ